MPPIPQSAPNTDWLDEELRKQKALTNELRETVAKQQVILADQAQRILGLEDRLTKLQAQLQRMPEIEEALRHTRDSVAVMISELRQEQQKRETDFLRNRQAEREQDVRAIHQIETELKRFEPLEQAMAVRQAEERRLNEGVLRIEQELQDLTKRLSQREDVIRQLTDRIDRNAAKIDQAQLAVEQAQKAQQEHVARLLLAETALSKAEQKITEIQGWRQDLAKQQEQLAENQRRSERDQAQIMVEWARKLEGYGHQLEIWTEQLRFFTDQHEKNRRVVREVQELAHQVSQQQDQLRQTQRLAEEQLRNEFRQWVSDNDRRWAQELERRGKAQEAQAQRDDGQDQRMLTLEQWREQDVAATQALSNRLDKTHEQLLAALQVLRQTLLRALQSQAKAYQDMYADLRGFLEEEK